MLIKLTFFHWVKKFHARTVCTTAWNFVSYRTLIHSTIFIIYAKPGSMQKKPLRRTSTPIKSPFKHSDKIMSFLHLLRAAIRYRSIFLL